MPDAAGWYGKLPSLGDFASRRLSPDFVEAWDDWLARGLAGWREQSPDTWLDAYLAAPSWRFIVSPGVLPAACGTVAWAGVLMPSVDNVGRYFPLTLAQPLAAPPADAASAVRLLAELQRLDDVALDALNEDWPVATLESALQDVADRADVEPQADPGLVGQVLERLAERPRGGVLWIRGDADGRPSLHACDGLPEHAAFAALLGAAPSVPSSIIPSESESP